MRTAVDITVRVVIEINDNAASIDEVIQEMNYEMTSNLENTEIKKTEIIGHKILG